MSAEVVCKYVVGMIEITVSDVFNNQFLNFIKMECESKILCRMIQAYGLLFLS